MFEVDNKDIRTRHFCRSSVFIVNFEHISHLFLVLLLLTLNRLMFAGLYYLLKYFIRVVCVLVPFYLQKLSKKNMISY